MGLNFIALFSITGSLKTLHFIKILLVCSLQAPEHRNRKGNENTNIFCKGARAVLLYLVPLSKFMVHGQ